MKNDWQRIWNARTVDKEQLLEMNDKDLYMALKKMAGFDMTEGDTLYRGFMEQFRRLHAELSFSVQKNDFIPLTSVFEVGGVMGPICCFFKKMVYRLSARSIILHPCWRPLASSWKSSAAVKIWN